MDLSFFLYSMKSFESLLEGWMLDEDNGETKDEFPWKVSEEDLILLKEKVIVYVHLKKKILSLTINDDHDLH